MPIVDVTYGSQFNLRHDSVYVSGDKLTRFELKAVQRSHPGVKCWSHDSFLPPLRHIAWIIPLHAGLCASLYGAVSARTGPGIFLFVSLSLLMLFFCSDFWIHIMANAHVNTLRKERTRTYSTQLGRSIYSWTRALDPICASKYCEEDESLERPQDFQKWLLDELNVDASCFTQVYPLVDEFLGRTAYARTLAQKDPYLSRELREKIQSAGDTAFLLIKPIYDEATLAKNQAKADEDARIARETEFKQSEAARITQQRIAMAIEDVDCYIDGHSELSNRKKLV